ncbi:pantoate--beta-alanine ligase [Alkalibaculum sp. M08DMB]|uniref:Pantothenate synthetase n=1 Tax=Alkalibaculum sporogenes TaxID=2655001 RepID=A0A6A7K8G1_9FIRM|nr:pantoate--beta-alanine ligase [Alkalibaculum sporogenes]MPW25768.1 pantoate--beta-alanine ligase [Alkalibaculum sporogenes]
MLVESIKNLREILIKHKSTSESRIGFVPTMGYLHEGHLSLINKAKVDNTFVVVSVFVNPTQFSPGEDYENYPRNIENDYKLAMIAGADVVFYPSVEEIYPEGASTFVEVEGSIVMKLCAHSRPSHFKGVTTVVNKLFNIVKPDNVYFGQKDAQQCMVIKKMVSDLHIDINVVVCPIIREFDGLALSSRNTYLNKKEREQSILLYKSLVQAKLVFDNGINDVKTIKETIRNIIQKSNLAQIEYIEILGIENFETINVIDRRAIALVAVKFGSTRLIDNVIIEKE